MLFLKAYRDVTRRRIRSLLTLAAVLIGVAGVVAIITTGQALTRAQAEAYANASQADITFWVWDAPDSLTRVLATLPNVRAVEIRNDLYTRCQFPNGEWRDVRIFGLYDFPNTRVNKIFLTRGRYPLEGELLAETTATELVAVSAGDTLTCRAREGGHAQPLTLVGFAQTPNYPSAALLDFITLYAPARDVQKLLGIAGANGALLQVNDFAQADRTARDVRSLLDRRGLSHDNGLIRDPLNFPGKREIDALVLLLSVFSGVGLVTSGILVANTLAAITAEQVGEIGTMKAIGGTRWQILRVYLASALIYGLIGTACGLIIGTAIGWLLIARIASLLNLDSTLTASPFALAVGAGLGVFVTLAGGAIPSFAATNIPVKEALEAYGISSTFGRGLIDRAVSRFVALPPLIAMSIRNLARRKGRSLITVIIIAVAVATSLAAQSVSTSVQNALDELFKTYHADAWVWMGEWVSSNFDGALRASPDVTRVETWSLDDAWVSTDGVAGVPAGGHSGAKRIVKARLWGLPAATTLYVPRLVKGRWYRASESDAVVISTDLAQSMMLNLGDSIRIESGPGSQTFRVTGITVDNSVFLGSTVAGKVFLRDDIVANLQQREGWAIFFAVAFAHHEVASVEASLAALAQKFQSYSISTDSAARQSKGLREQSRVLTAALVAMSLIVGAIGALGVANTLALNVLERRREIGVLRVVGASDARLVEGFLAEGLMFGVLGWAIGLLAGYPLGLVLTRTFETVLFHIDFVFSLQMILLSLAFALVLAGGASLIPALAAARMRVSEVLRYE